MPFDWKTFGDEVVDVVKGAISIAIEPINRRLSALEERKPERGEKGDAGINGKDGAPGLNGKDGADGRPGDNGKDGDIGPAGPKGEPGENGKDGAAGRDGRDGAPGRDGKDGVDGKPGLDGKDGAPGLNGKDGLGFDDIQVEHDGERGFKFIFIRGDQRKEFGSFIVPSMIYRGVWTEGDYREGDVVTWAGSMFVAIGDTKTKPETKDSAWRLAVKRGKDGVNGKDGKPGDRGAEGPRGRDGMSFHA